MERTFTLKIVEKLKETTDAITIRFKQPALKKVKYKAGQYITLIVRIGDRVYRRAYSLASVYELDKTLDITVKMIPNGIVSTHLLKNIIVGDSIEIMEPAGRFTLPENCDELSFVFWCAGSGITPVFSLIRSLLFNYSNCNISLIYCNRKRSSVIFNKQLNELAEHFQDRFKIRHVFSRPEKEDNPYFFEGRISKLAIDKVLENTDHFHVAHHYICGPEEFMDLISIELTLHNISSSRIHSENFHQSIDPTKLSGVIPSLVSIDFQNNHYSFPVNAGKNVLEALLDQGVNFPYSCQTGSCTFCKATLEEGTVKTISHQKPEKPLADTEALLCCSYPLTAHLKLKA